MIGHDLARQPAAAATDRWRAWIDGIAPRLIESAARRAPATLAARLEEEWLADLFAQRGLISRLNFALGCLWAATVISLDGDSVATTARPSPGVSTAMATHRRYQGPRLFARRTISTPEGTLLSDINTTPLIDVMLVLLVTLIVSLPLMTHAVTLNLPQAAPVAANVRPEVIELSIDFDGTVVWNGATLASWQQLENNLHSEAQKTPQAQIHLFADRRVKYGVVARVLAAAQRNRLQQIGLAGTARFKD
jgi:biopolymer transport protein ExbD